MKRILAISGSTRKKSSNEAILQYVANNFKDQIELDLFQGIDQLPHFNPDLDKYPLPEAIAKFRTKIETSEGIIICTPEYVFSLPGSLKNAIEWLVSTTLLSGKPVALIVAAASGQKAFESLDLIMTTLEAQVLPGSKVQIEGIKGKVNQKRQITDLATKEKINSSILSLINSIN